MWLEVIRHLFQPLRNIDCSNHFALLWYLQCWFQYWSTLLCIFDCGIKKLVWQMFQILQASIHRSDYPHTVPPWLHLSQVYLESWSSTVRHPVQLIGCLNNCHCIKVSSSHKSMGHNWMMQSAVSDQTLRCCLLSRIDMTFSLLHARNWFHKLQFPTNT